MKRFFMLTVALAGLTALAACGEKPQTLGGVKSDVAPYQGTDNAFAAPGWTKGDKVSWEQGLKARAQNTQNEYPRINSGK